MNPGIFCKAAKVLSIGMLVFFLACCAQHEDHSHDKDGRESHSGQKLEKDGFQLQVKIYEKGVEPQFRLFAFDHGAPVSADKVKATITLSRLGQTAEKYTFKPADKFLVSDQAVYEPHSFDAAVHVEYMGKTFDWTYSSYEGRVTLTQAQVAASKIETEDAGPRQLRVTSRVRGKVTPSEHRISHIIPRFAGVVREGRKHIGDRVSRGEVMAVVESNQSLQPYEVRSQIDGIVISGHLIVGEYVTENQPVYVVADLSEVWADFLVPFEENTGIKSGQELVVADAQGRELAKGVISYAAPYADERSQAQLVRAVLPNQDGRLLPGMYVVADVTTASRQVPVAIRNQALQTMSVGSVVFARFGDIFEARPVETGISDGEWSEVLHGLAAGTSYVVANSFVIKADILKAGAAHDH